MRSGPNHENKRKEACVMARISLKRNLPLRALNTLACVTVGLMFLLSSPVTAGQGGSSSAPKDAVSDWKQVEDAMGRPGQMQPNDVIKFSMPRKDLHVTLAGVDIKPGLALGSWAAFERDGGGAMVMGDLGGRSTTFNAQTPEERHSRIRHP